MKTTYEMKYSLDSHDLLPLHTAVFGVYVQPQILGWTFCSVSGAPSRAWMHAQWSNGHSRLFPIFCRIPQGVENPTLYTDK